MKQLLKSIKPVSPNLKLFLVGGVTSGGTTVLSSLLDQHFVNQATVHESQLHFRKSSPLRAYFIKQYTTFEDYRHDVFEKHKALHSLRDFRRHCHFVYRKKSGYSPVIYTVIDKSPNYHLARGHRYFEAFDHVQMVVVLRDPRAVIEGMMRKWPLFNRAGANTLSIFWKELFECFLTHTDSLRDRIVFLSLDTLQQQQEWSLNALSSRLGLKRRSTLKRYPTAENKPGRALRNVNEGRIILTSAYKELWKENLTNSEVHTIESITMPLYRELVNMANSAFSPIQHSG